MEKVTVWLRKHAVPVGAGILVLTFFLSIAVHVALGGYDPAFKARDWVALAVLGSGSCVFGFFVWWAR